MSNYRRFFAALAIGLLSACAPDDPPGQRQLACTRAALGSNPGETMTLLLDLGKHSVVRLDGADHGASALSWDAYSYRFGAAGASISIGRYDGKMVVERAVLSSGKQRVRRTENWSCSARKLGTIF